MSGVSGTEKKFAVSVISYIRSKINGKQISSDQAESLEVAIQCLETGFDITDNDYAFQASQPIVEIFSKFEGLSIDGDSSTTDAKKEPTAEDRAAADALKAEGNDLMRSEAYAAAIEKYSAALDIVADPVYYCNRAAAHGKMDKHDLAIQDCRAAIAMNPRYAKAYGRMGLALSAQGRYSEAVNACRTALEIDPENLSHQHNLDIALENAGQEQQTQQANAGTQGANPFAAMFGGAGGAAGAPGAGGPGGLDLGSLLNNPAMVQMATQVMADPNMQNMMGNLMSGMMNQPGGQGGGMGNLLQAGQQLAQQLQQANPELIERLRNQTQGDQQNPDNDPSNNPPGQGS